MNWIINAGNLQFLERGLKLTHEGRVHVRCDEPLMHNRLCRCKSKDPRIEFGYSRWRLGVIYLYVASMPVCASIDRARGIDQNPKCGPTVRGCRSGVSAVHDAFVVSYFIVC